MAVSMVYQSFSLQLSCGVCEKGMGFHALQERNGSSPDSQILLTKLLLGFWLWLAAPTFLMIVDFVYLQYRSRSNAHE